MGGSSVIKQKSFVLSVNVDYIALHGFLTVVFTMRRISVSAHIALLLKFELQCMAVMSCVM